MNVPRNQGDITVEQQRAAVVELLKSSENKYIQDFNEVFASSNIKYFIMDVAEYNKLLDHFGANARCCQMNKDGLKAIGTYITEFYTPVAVWSGE